MMLYQILISIGTFNLAYIVFETFGEVIDRLWIGAQTRINELTTD